MVARKSERVRGIIQEFRKEVALPMFSRQSTHSDRFVDVFSEDGQWNEQVSLLKLLGPINILG